MCSETLAKVASQWYHLVYRGYCCCCGQSEVKLQLGAAAEVRKRAHAQLGLVCGTLRMCIFKTGPSKTGPAGPLATAMIILKSIYIYMAEGCLSINPCSMSREARLNLGSLTTVKCALTYWLIALLHNHSNAFPVLPGNDAFLQHRWRLSCKASLVLLASK